MCRHDKREQQKFKLIHSSVKAVQCHGWPMPKSNNQIAEPTTSHAEIYNDLRFYFFRCCFKRGENSRGC